MLFFRSEERVREWCRERDLPVRPMVTLEQLRRLADAWYADRLDPTAHRPGPGEMVEIFSSIGLDGPFWDPGAEAR